MLMRKYQQLRSRLHLRIYTMQRNRARSGARFYGRFRTRVHRARASAFLRFYEAEVKRCERSQRADKTVSIPPSVSAIAFSARRDEGRTGRPARRVGASRFTLCAFVPSPRVRSAITASISWKKSS